MTPQEQQHAREVLEFFYPNALEPNQEISLELADLATQMLQEALKGSHAMDWVPRPAGVRPGIRRLISQAVEAFWRTPGRRKTYETIRRKVSLGHRSEFELATKMQR